MPELAYVNGLVTPVDEARVSIEDRGFQFSDGIYEVVRTHNGGFIDLERHLARLERSATMLDLALPMPLPELERVSREFYAQSALPEAIFYLQVTRGAAPRRHTAPPGLTPTLVMTVRAITQPPPERYTAITVPNNRWKLCACKSIGLLPAVLAKHAALRAGADEAVFVEDGLVLEGASDNFFAVKDGVVYTPDTDGRILAGVTRERVLEQLAERGARVEVGPLPLELARSADEAFITSSVLTVVPIVALDGRPVGDGRPGPVTGRAREDYWDFIRRTTA
ncbi:MAG: aminotransferase class IV [Bacillota bacterium]